MRQILIPNRNEALELHRRLGSSDEIVKHCEAVADVASKIAERFSEKGFKNLDAKAIFAAALLHDIGRTKTHGPDHGYVGSELLKENNVDDSVSRIVARHVGAGISREEAEKLGLPEGDYIARTLEERIVCFSDKLVGHHGKRVPFELEIAKFKKKGLDVARLDNLKRSLQIELGEDPEAILSEATL
jgi:uncharacterized protein (TIGR00295 family)